jgi:hypothetical protein
MIIHIGARDARRANSNVTERSLTGVLNVRGLRPPPRDWRPDFATKMVTRDLSILAAGAAAAASLLVLAHRRRQDVICQPCDITDDLEMKGGATLLTPPRRNAGTPRALSTAL